MPDDYYVSQYSGEEIDERLTAAHNAVRYDAAQTLTDAQKAQARNNISAMQGIESTDHPGCYYVLNGSAVEWINPPMQLGIEYRTTERYLGKPVYTKLVDCGEMPSKTTKTVGVGVENLCHKLSVKARMYYSNYDNWTLPLHNGSFDADVWFNNQGISIRAQQSGLSSYTGYATIKYTKTTD